MKNRYARGSKLSEHKFLRLLQGYADAVPITTLEPTTRVSAKTIRTTYAALRAALPAAVSLAPHRFGAAGSFLSHELAPHWLASIRQSRIYQRHRRQLAPRVSCPLAEEYLATEMAVRILCALDLRAVTLEAGEIITCMTRALPQLRSRAPLDKLAAFIPGARAHSHPTHRLFEDLRRTLLKHPLGSQYLGCPSTVSHSARARMLGSKASPS